MSIGDSSHEQLIRSRRKGPWRTVIDPVGDSQPQGLLDFPPATNVFLECDLRFWQLLRVQISNLFFNIVTLGTYRFWGRTRLRQAIWHSIGISGLRLIYHGSGLELFVANLLAIIVFLLPLAVLALVQMIVPTHSVLWWISASLTALILYFLWFFGQFLRYRYWADKTTWSGITGRVGGRALLYASIALWQGVLVLLTLGLWWPNMQLRLSRYLVNCLTIGNYNCRWIEERSGLFSAWVLNWGIGFLAAVSWVGFALTWLLSSNMAQNFASSLFFFTAILCSSLLPLSYLAYKATLIRCCVASFVLGDLYTFSLVKWKSMLWIWIRTSTIFLLFLLILFLLVTLTFQIWNPVLSGVTDAALVWARVFLPPEVWHPNFMQTKILIGTGILLLAAFMISRAVSVLLEIVCWAHLHKQTIVIEGQLDFSKLSNVPPGRHRSLGEGIALSMDFGGL